MASKSFSIFRNARCLPVLRPDLLPTRDGFALTEWDSVPGGIGLTDHLGRIYLGEDAPEMAKAFGQSLLEQAGKLGEDSQFAILVSENQLLTVRDGMVRGGASTEWIKSRCGSTR